MFLMLLIDFFVYLFLGFYLENVIPSEYGTPKPFYFLFTKKYWSGIITTEKNNVHPFARNRDDCKYNNYNSFFIH